MNRLIIVFVGLFTIIQVDAQLLNEIGVSVGGTNYTGDIGNELFIFPNKVGWNIKYKRNHNSRIAYRASFSNIPLYDNDNRSFNKIRNNRGLSFSNKVNEISFGVEFNYFPYDVLDDNRGITPYLFIDVAGLYYQSALRVNSSGISYKKKFSYSVPFGVGLKSKITDYIGYAIELKVSPTFEDDLDTSELLEIGNPNTNDWYYFTGITLTYSFGRMPCYFPRPF